VSDEQTFDRLKWTVLDEAGFHHNAGIAYYWAARAFPGRETHELDDLVQRALIDLLDEELIFFHWGGWDDGVDVDPHTAKRATRAEVEADLRRGGDADPTPETVWFTSTEAGEAKLATIPAEVFLGYEDEIKRKAFLSRHPEFPQRQQEWLQAKERWVREGGRMPRPPSTKYPDWPFEQRGWRWYDSLPGSRLGTLIARVFFWRSEPD